MKKNMVIVLSSIILVLWAGLASAQSYFEDSFGGASLDARWVQDNSPTNIMDGSLPDGGWLSVADGYASTTCLQEAYNHLQTVIDASGQFGVEARLRVNGGMGAGAVHLAVYWDEVTYVSLKWGKSGKLTVSYSDAANYYEIESNSAQSTGWQQIRLRFEFDDDVIRCYGQLQNESEMVYYPELDIPRTAVFQAASALVIVGKGTMSPDDTNSDFNNDGSSVAASDLLSIDHVRYWPLMFEVDPDFFVDGFDGSDLDARWTCHNSPANDPNYPENIFVGGGIASALNPHQEAYCHLETVIDASKDFAVQVDSRINSGMGTGANHLVVYWDFNNYICLTAGRAQFMHSEVSENGAYTKTATSEYYAGYAWTYLRIEFLEDTIKFYAGKQGDPNNLTYWPELDLPREDWTKRPYAKMIIGKGDMWDHNSVSQIPNTDFNNDQSNVYGIDVLWLDNAMYEPLGTYHCGDPGTVYLTSDLNGDCLVNLSDVSVFAGQWLWCSDPTSGDCEQYWKTAVYFEDSFDGPGLGPRWVEDNSSANPSGSDFAITIPGTAESSTNLQEAYHHLQTSVDTTADFSVEAKVGIDQGMGVGGAHFAVYWDQEHFVGLTAGRAQNVKRELYDGGSFSRLDSTKYSVGWDDYVLKMEFVGGMVKFYIGNGDDGHVPVYHSELDMARQSWMTGDALLIVGKGSGDPALGGNTDFNNDAANVYGADTTRIDYVSYLPIDVNACGDPGTVYFVSDLVRDCYIDLFDFAKFTNQWLWCTDPALPECDSYWK